MVLWRSRVLPPLAVALLVAAMAVVPALRDPRFYLTDDSAAQFLPSWYHLGQLLRAGRFPLLDPTLWAGGNIAAEALFGVWNPVLLATMLLVSAVPNLVVASVLVKACVPGDPGPRRVRARPRVRRAARLLRRRRGHRALRRGDLLLRRRVVVVRADRLRLRPLVLVDVAPLRPGRAEPGRPVRRGLPRHDRGQPVRRARRVPRGGGPARRVRVDEAARGGRAHAARRDRRRPRGPADLPAAGAHPVRHLPERLQDRQQRADGARPRRPPQCVHAQLRGLGRRLRAPLPDRAGDLPGLVRPPAPALAALPRDRRRPRVADGRARVHGRGPGPVGRAVGGLDVPLAAAGGALLRPPDGGPAGDRTRPGPGGRPPAAAGRRVRIDHPRRGVPGRGHAPRPPARPRRVGAAGRGTDGRRRDGLAAVAPRSPGPVASAPRARVGPARRGARRSAGGVRRGPGVPGVGVPPQPEPQRLPVPHLGLRDRCRPRAPLPRHRAGGGEQRRGGALRRPRGALVGARCSATCCRPSACTR